MTFAIVAALAFLAGVRYGRAARDIELAARIVRAEARACRAEHALADARSVLTVRRPPAMRPFDFEKDAR